jgi:hypothetical protein
VQSHKHRLIAPRSPGSQSGDEAPALPLTPSTMLSLHACLFFCHLPPHASQEAVERGYAYDVAGQRAQAISTYRQALEIMDEGLQLVVAGTGLQAPHSNVSAWRGDMSMWQHRVAERWVVW